MITLILAGALQLGAAQTSSSDWITPKVVSAQATTLPTLSLDFQNDEKVLVSCPLKGPCRLGTPWLLIVVGADGNIHHDSYPTEHLCLEAQSVAKTGRSLKDDSANYDMSFSMYEDWLRKTPKSKQTEESLEAQPFYDTLVTAPSNWPKTACINGDLP